MRNVVLLFPGQGNIDTQLLRKLYKRSAEIKCLIEQASDYVKIDYARIIHTDDLVQTQYQQPLISIMSAAYLERIKNFNNTTTVIGHSLGELSACYAAGVISFSSLIQISHWRAKYMQGIAETLEGGMLIILSTNSDELSALVSNASKYNLSIANINSDNQVVLSGLTTNLRSFISFSKHYSHVVTKFLKVNGPWHSHYMLPMLNRFRLLLNEHPIYIPRNDLWLSYFGEKCKNNHKIKSSLVKQVCNTVDWMSLVRKIDREYQPIHYIEVGIGSTLKNLNKRILPNAKSYSISDKLDEKRLNRLYCI